MSVIGLGVTEDSSPKRGEAPSTSLTAEESLFVSSP